MSTSNLRVPKWSLERKSRLITFFFCLCVSTSVGKEALCASMHRLHNTTRPMRVTSNHFLRTRWCCLASCGVWMPFERFEPTVQVSRSASRPILGSSPHTRRYTLGKVRIDGKGPRLRNSKWSRRKHDGGQDKEGNFGNHCCCQGPSCPPDTQDDVRVERGSLASFTLGCINGAWIHRAKIERDFA